MSDPANVRRVVPPTFTVDEAEDSSQIVTGNSPITEVFPVVLPVFPVVLPDGASSGDVTKFVQPLDSKVTTLPAFDDPSVKCGTCVHSVIIKTPFLGNRRADGKPFEKSIGYCTYFKAEPLALEDIRPTSCNRYSAMEKDHG